ncbi:thiol-disulfide isomerase [Candidatus Parcubacteria bacterium]|nr:MAG: thiol-disulfide isomerase [Candidatus Parcubacteria bacterium]
MKTGLLVLVSVLIVGSIVYLEAGKVRPPAPQDLAVEEVQAPAASGEAEGDGGNSPAENSFAPVPKPIGDKSKLLVRAKEITTPDGFINTDKITIGEHVGKSVVLLDIWTYSCINCQRTIPYLNAWWQKYKDKGLVIVGLHTPEFEFEKKYENVLAAVKKFGVGYPVVLDNDYSTWHAYANRYWPRKYLIDIDGYIVYDHIGEGSYEETEKRIQVALAERMERLGMKGGIAADVAKPSGAQAVDPRGLGSPEVYFGANRNEYLGNGAIGTVGWQELFPPANVLLNKLYLVGDWNIQSEYAETRSAARIIFRYKAKNVYLVGSAASPVTVHVLRDGKPVGAEAGEDVKSGTMTIKDDRLYKVIEDSSYGEHTLELLIENPGFKVFTFTFG